MKTLSGLGRLLLACGLVIGTAERAAAAPPTVSGLVDRTVGRDFGLGPFEFTVGDDATDPDALVVTASSSNDALVPDANVLLGGSGATRWMSLRSLQGTLGTTTITVNVSDGTETTTKTFTLTVVNRLSWFFAEGATGAFFDTDIVIGCPSRALVTALKLTFFKEDGTTVEYDTHLLAPESRTTIHVDDIPGMEATAFSTLIESVGANNPDLSIERTMRWDASRYGAHTEKAGLGAAPQWFFAEGSQGFFFTYFLLVNPAATDNVAHVTYFREGASPIVRDYPMGPRSRRTIYAGDEPALVNTSFGARVDFDSPGMAERAMYFGSAPLFNGGHASAGVTAPATEWFLAEGATGSFFSTFVLLANPDTQPAEVTLTYLPATGAPIVKQATIAAGARLTKNMATEDPALADAAVGVRIQASRPIVVERSQYWPNPAPTWYEAHNSFGVTETSQRWGLGEGGVGGPNNEQTYILVANPGTVPAQVTATFLLVNPTKFMPPKPFTVPPASRLNIAVTGPGSDVPELANQKFSVLIEATEPVVVEESFYSDAGGATWAAGTNATGSVFLSRGLIAVVGPDRSNVPIGTTVTLGVDSPGFDPSLIKQWTLLSRPAGSAAALSDAGAEHPTFLVDVAGDYVVQLVERKGPQRSAPERVRITTANPGVEVSIVATDAAASVEPLDPGTFTVSRIGGDLTQPLSVVVSLSGLPVFSVPRLGTDYEPFGEAVPVDTHVPHSIGGARTITIPANQTSVAVTLTPKPSAFRETEQTVTATIVTSLAYTIGQGSASITIADPNP
jgi:hypothetical protein